MGNNEVVITEENYLELVLSIVKEYKGEKLRVADNFVNEFTRLFNGMPILIDKFQAHGINVPVQFCIEGDKVILKSLLPRDTYIKEEEQKKPRPRLMPAMGPRPIDDIMINIHQYNESRKRAQ